MESDLPLIEIAEEDDSLIQQLPDLDQTPCKSPLSYSTFSSFALPPSHAQYLKDGIRMDKPCSSSSEAIKNKENINSNSVEVPKLGMEPMQMKRRKKGAGYNLRKSLAWDRAFFTDEGILDPLELTLITGIDASTRGRGLSTITEEGNSSFSSDVKCTIESNDTEAPLKEIRDKNRTIKGNKEKTDCLMRNHGSLLNHKVTHKVLSSDRANRAGPKVGGCSEPIAASSLKRPANSNTKTSNKESKIPKLPISKPGSCFYANNATTKGCMAASQFRHNLIPKPTKNVEKNFGSKSSLQNAHGSQSKTKTGSGNLHLPVKELVNKTTKKLTHSSKAASSTRSRLVQVDGANSGLEMVPDTLRSCKIQEESTPLAAKHLTQHAAENSNNSLSESSKLTSSGPCNIQSASKGLMSSDRLNSRESQDRLAALARPSGLRLPSPSLRLFDLRTSSESSSLQQKKVQQYMGSDRIYGKECCSPVTRLSPSPNYMLNTSTKRLPYSNVLQNLVTKVVPMAGIKLEYECRGSEQQKKAGTRHQLMSESRVPETKCKSVVHKKEDGLQSYTASSMSTFGQSSHYQEESISTLVVDLAQTSWEQVDTEKSDDVPLKVTPESHLDAGSQVFVGSHEQDGIRKIEDDVGPTKGVAPGIESYSGVLSHGQENDVSKVVDDKSLPMEEHDVTELKCVDSSCIPFQKLNTEQIDDADGADVLSTTTTTTTTKSPRVRDQSAELHDSPVRDTVTQLLNDSPSSKGLNIETTLSIGNKHKLPITLLLHDNPSSTEGLHLILTNSINNKSQLQDTGIANGSPKCFEATTPCISALLNSQLSDSHIMPKDSSCLEEDTFHNVTDIIDHFFQVKSVSDQKQDGFDPQKSVSSAPLIDHNQFSGLSHLKPQVEFVSETTSVVDDDTLVKGEPVLQGGRCTSTYPQSLEKERLDIATPTVEAQHADGKSLPVEEDDSPCSRTISIRFGVLQHEVDVTELKSTDTEQRNDDADGVDVFSTTTKSPPVRETVTQLLNDNPSAQGFDIEVAPLINKQVEFISEAEKSQHSHGNISEVEPTVQWCTGGSETHYQFQCENQTLEGSEPIGNISKTNEEDGLAQLSDGDHILPVVQVNVDNQPQGFVGITHSVETHDYFTNGKSDSRFSVSQELTTGVETTSTPELCCLVGRGDVSLLTETTCMTEAEGSKTSIVDATPMVGEFQHELDDLKDHRDATVLTKTSNSIKMQDNSLVIHAVPFSDEWLAAFEAAGEEILSMKCGAVQHSPQDKSVPEPSPWSPVKKKGSQIGPYDCTKYMNAMPSSSEVSD